MGQHTIEVTEAQFQTQVLDEKLPVLVDFWAEWCGPCKMISPILEEVAKDYAGKLVVAKVNVDHSPALASKYGIRGIPSLLLFKEGAIEGTKHGALSKQALVAFLEEYI